MPKITSRAETRIQSGTASMARFRYGGGGAGDGTAALPRGEAGPGGVGWVRRSGAGGSVMAGGDPSFDESFHDDRAVSNPKSKGALGASTKRRNMPRIATDTIIPTPATAKAG